MEMVATTKLRRFQGRAQSSRPFAAEIEKIVARLAAAAPEGTSPLLRKHASGGATGEASKGSGAPAAAQKGVMGIVVVTSDRGLCGAYNTNLLALVHRTLRERGLEQPGSKGSDLSGRAKLYVFGKKGYTYFYKRGYEVAHYFAEPPLEKFRYQDVRVVAKQLVNDFLSGAVSEIHVVSTRFESMVTFKPSRAQWLPLVPSQMAGSEAVGDGADESGTIIEPSVDSLLTKLVPKYLEMKLWNLLLEALTSEYASRRVSMKNATDAAEEMRGTLLRTYNRARQESITKQLLEIVGGAEALN